MGEQLGHNLLLRYNRSCGALLAGARTTLMKSTADEPIVIGETPTIGDGGRTETTPNLRWKVGVGAGLILVVSVILFQLAANGRAIEDLASVPDSTTDVRAQGAVEAWVWAALAGDTETAARLTFGEQGERTDLTELAQNLSDNLLLHGPPLVRIEANPATVSPEYVCVDLAFGSARVEGVMVVRTWPDMGRRLWKFFTAYTGCPLRREGPDEALVATQNTQDAVLTDHAESIRTAAINVVRPEGVEPLGFDSFVLIFAEGDEFALRGRAVFPSGCRWLGLAGRDEQGATVVSGSLVNDAALNQTECATR